MTNPFADKEKTGGLLEGQSFGPERMDRANSRGRRQGLAVERAMFSLGPLTSSTPQGPSTLMWLARGAGACAETQAGQVPCLAIR